MKSYGLVRDWELAFFHSGTNRWRTCRIRFDIWYRGVARLSHRLATGMLPPMTRRIAVRLSAEAGSGDNDGYADELSIVLRRR